MTNLPYQDFLTKKLENPEFAAHYLLTYLDDGTPQEIATAISKILSARRTNDVPKIYELLLEKNRDVIGRAGIATAG